MFTLEIAGRPIAVTDADEAQAQELFESQEFKSDLRSLESERRPLWDGSAILNTRPASEDEIDAFEAAFSADDEADEDGINVMFLVPLDTTDATQGRPPK
jgi:hypothetical protein